MLYWTIFDHLKSFSGSVSRPCSYESLRVGRGGQWYKIRLSWVPSPLHLAFSGRRLLPRTRRILGDGVATTESDDWAQEKGFEWWRSCSGRKVVPSRLYGEGHQSECGSHGTEYKVAFLSKSRTASRCGDWRAGRRKSCRKLCNSEPVTANSVNVALDLTRTVTAHPGGQPGLNKCYHPRCEDRSSLCGDMIAS